MPLPVTPLGFRAHALVVDCVYSGQKENQETEADEVQEDRRKK